MEQADPEKNGDVDELNSNQKTIDKKKFQVVSSEMNKSFKRRVAGLPMSCA